ncbi:hypothetical protein SAMN04488045_3915 [Thalassococcus halodurans]|uniref:Uncharacterized protein n=2 Tax=Alphaproteobacteria TaxID=28211 RepID=A0A1H6C0M3_9RHOB|nr:hypothetical protein [Thalassococcus halodurans]SEG66462.1 hypothetical protein SAMN04488045_3915 [Thalassococcus halodurans]
MEKRSAPFEDRKRMTYLGEALVRRLDEVQSPLVSNYDLFVHLWQLHESGDVKYLRSEHPSRDTFSRTRTLLKQEGLLRRDKDYHSLWRVTSVSDVPADDAVCIADPFCYISHLSAMQRYGLTNRRPEALFLTRPLDAVVRQKLKERREEDFGEVLHDSEVYVEKLTAVRHPEHVRGRPVSILASKFFGSWRQVRASRARIGSVGQTFLDMLEAPERCGGMRHVLEAWEEHAKTYLEEIIRQVSDAPKAIYKVRAGYILSERLGIEDQRVLEWKSFAQRGGSRLLDPDRPYLDRYSEEWMISINV